MMGRGAVTLGDLVGRIDRLEVRCRRCDRHGRMRLARLIKEHGDDLGLPELARVLANGVRRPTRSIRPIAALSSSRSWPSCS
jgi:hypothetical protein